jgi:hypothetical protein
MEYDENREEARYIWDNFHRLLTEFEQQVGRAIRGRTKAAASDSPTLRKMLNERWGRVGDAQIESALADGAEAFRQRVARRVLAEHASEVVINRCPACGRVVRIPRARQCFWCGLDWHG